jgi:Kelch motif
MIDLGQHQQVTNTYAYFNILSPILSSETVYSLFDTLSLPELVKIYFHLKYAFTVTHMIDRYNTHIDRWNSTTKSWRYGTPMITGRFGCGGAILGNEFFVVGGGLDVAMDLTEAYCFTTGKWRQCAAMVAKRCYTSVSANL